MFILLGLTCLLCFPDSLFLRVIVSSSVITLILLLIMCLCCIEKSGQMIGLNFAVNILWLTCILIPLFSYYCWIKYLKIFIICIDFLRLCF